MNPATTLLTSVLRNDHHRLLKLYFPREDGPEAGLLLNALDAVESVSGDFCYTLELLSDDATIDPCDVQGKMICVEMMRDDGQSRHFNGHCFEFILDSVTNGLARYTLIARPWLALFTLRRDHFAFHQQNITDQTKHLFNETGLARHEFRLYDPDPVRTYSCQYDETHYAYLHRRWEEMGWYYWYEHDMNGHKLILSDASTTAEPLSGGENLAWHHDGGSNREDKLDSWQAARKLVSGKVSFSHFDFKKPQPQKAGDTGDLPQGDIHKVEVYRYQGLYPFRDAGHATGVAKRHVEQIEAEAKLFHGRGNCRNVQPGRWFRLRQDHEGLAVDVKDQEFFILHAHHRASNNYLNAEGGQAWHRVEFSCIPRAVRWRPPASTPVPHVGGVDTATVVGPKGEEIHTDSFGRIKVQFHWDRAGRFDEKTSAWVRVQTPWANQNFGIISVPRVGTEVVVQYLQGNPDRPLVTGQVWNQTHMPPWALPAHATQSGIVTRSSKGGTAAHANALRFEDKKGEEQVWLHAERNFDTSVEHDDSQTVGHDRHIHVKGKHDETIDKDMSLKVDGGLAETIKKGMITEVTDGAQSTTVKGDITVTTKEGEIILSSPKKITLKVGDHSYIVIEKDQITIQSPMVDVNPD